MEGVLQTYIFVTNDYRGLYALLNIVPDQQYWTQLVEESASSTYYETDPVLGWTIKPNGIFRDSLYVANELGIRISGDDIHFDKEPKKVGIFGDSFIHSDDVRNSESLTYHIQKSATKQGLNLKVYNFGVSGYDITQAFLRYKQFQEIIDFDIVIAGMQVENFYRNLNIYRPNSYTYTGFPFLKPRAVLDNNKLEVIEIQDNSFSALKSIPCSLKTLPNYEYEFFKDRTICVDYGILGTSLTFKLVHSIIFKVNHVPIPSINEYKYGQTLMHMLFNEFQENAILNNSSFYLLQLPDEKYINDLQQNKFIASKPFVDSLLASMNSIRVDSTLIEFDTKSTFAGHYSDYGNSIIAELIIEQITK